MQLTKQTDYALRSLIYLAGSPRGDYVNIKDICDFYDLSPNHISKLVVKLVRLGYVESIRGKGGGIRLRMDPAEIELVNVVKEFETTLQVVNCTEPRCAVYSPCKLRGLLSKATLAFINTLNGYTLADIVNDELNPIQIVRMETGAK